MKVKTLNIALPEDLLVETDKLAKKEYRNRSELIREALRTYIKNSLEWEELFGYGENIAKTKKIKPEDVEKVVNDWRKTH